jgi:AcrR family transcriptional regulator
MKISKKEKLKNRKRIVQIAIELIGSNGYKKSSMRKIAKKAKIGEATIYNYFPTKEHIIFEYYHSLQVETRRKILELEEFNTFSLKEQIEHLIGVELELMLENRAFVLEVYREIFYKSFYHSELQRGTDEFLDMVGELIDIAIEVGEIEPIEFTPTLRHLFGDYFFGVIYYWIHDESENFDNTSIMLDRSLEVIYAVLKSGLISKLEELFSFVVKTHVLNHIKPTGKKFSKRGLKI